MTKKEMVALLVNKYGVEDKGLMRKTVKELENMITKAEKEFKVLEEVEEDTIMEEVEELEPEVEEKLEDVAEIDELDFTSEGIISEVQLNIYETIVRRFEPARNIQIENLGAGDIYIGKTKEKLIQEKNKVAPGQGEYIPNVSILYITSASRPIVRIIY